MDILLASGEHKAQLELIGMLDELYPGEHNYAQAKDGREMIARIDSKPPDIAFIDINILLTDELAISRTCLQKHTYTQYFIVSDHSNFEYARNNIHMDGVEYLFNPISLDDLHYAVEIAKRNIICGIQPSNVNFAYEMSTIYNTMRPIYGRQDALSSLPYYSLNVYVFDINARDSATIGEINSTLIYYIRTEMERYPSREFQYTLFFLESGNLCLITNGKNKNEIPFLDSLLLNLNQSVTCLYEENICPRDLYNKCREIVESVNIRVLYGHGRLICLDPTLIQKASKNRIFLNNIDELCAAFLKNDEIQYNNILNKMCATSNFPQILKNSDRYNIAHYFHNIVGFDVNVESTQEFIGSLIEGAQYIVSQETNFEFVSTDINWIKEYINMNYMKGISLNTIAQLLNITPNYLSKIFHERMGCKFIDYISDVRINNAKNYLISHPGITVKEVANLVGYTSCRHFTKIFIRLTGCRPSEYISRYKKGELMSNPSNQEGE